jgi:CheY-like chemotaxis protein
LPCTISNLPQSEVNRTNGSRQATSRPGKRPAILAGLRVLVVDDLEDAREAFSVMLQSCRAQVETAVSAAGGLAALARFKPDIVLCDVAMPEEDGLSFIRKVRKLKPGDGGMSPAIAVTAHASHADVRAAKDAGFDTHIAKPVDAVKLSRLILKLSGRRKKAALIAG